MFPSFHIVKGCDSNFKIYVVITKSIYQMIRLNFMRKLCLLNCWSLLL